MKTRFPVSPIPRPRRVQITSGLALLLILLTADTALAQVGNMGRFEDLANTAIRIVQGLALVGCVAGFIRVGMLYAQGDDRAPLSLKNTGIGTAIVAGAAIIMEFIRSGLGA